ncbi:hypothetical protein L226DRAFT_299050 [Lentinus tigrinus ALCF2SS1-7]|uniref:uncharacterized protein n=1 Tax=Lentinus tigrinus ALCF2SS1-7 TaxID=1328758 RepID=UPI00116619E8|nr:hypothetical protein L226DRAFT_299050 [Lentinus tigrinus ALCF2SS1-7]
MASMRAMEGQNVNIPVPWDVHGMWDVGCGGTLKASRRGLPCWMGHPGSRDRQLVLRDGESLAAALGRSCYCQCQQSSNRGWGLDPHAHTSTPSLSLRRKTHRHARRVEGPLREVGDHGSVEWIELVKCFWRSPTAGSPGGGGRLRANWPGEGGRREPSDRATVASRQREAVSVRSASEGEAGGTRAGANGGSRRESVGGHGRGPLSRGAGVGWMGWARGSIWVQLTGRPPTSLRRGSA